MNPSTGRIVKAAALAAGQARLTAPAAPLSLGAGRVVARPIVDANLRAAELMRQAEQEAAALIGEARRKAEAEYLAIELEARARGTAGLAARMIAVRAREARALERNLAQSIQLAELLAERLLGRALSLEPALIVELARQALKDVQGAETLRLAAHPADARHLETMKRELQIPDAALEIVGDERLGPGDLELETELGSVDARLKPQLERLAKLLADSLRSPP